MTRSELAKGKWLLRRRVYLLHLVISFQFLLSRSKHQPHEQQHKHSIFQKFAADEDFAVIFRALLGIYLSVLRALYRVHNLNLETAKRCTHAKSTLNFYD